MGHEWTDLKYEMIRTILQPHLERHMWAAGMQKIAVHREEG